MEIKNVTKTQLRDYVDSKINKRKRELQNEIKTTITERMGEALVTVLGDISKLERAASKFEDLLAEKIHLLGADSIPNYATITASNANSLCNAQKYFLDEIVKNVLYAINNSTSSHARFKCEPLKGDYEKLKADLKPKIDLYRDGLDTLKRELHNAVSIEQTGKRAYNALVSLGVDMSDLPEANPNLPAVVKLSVDVCVLNGDCDKKASA